MAELKVQLKMVEETRDATRRDLIEANRAIREGDEARDLMRKEIVELKRLVNEEIHEKETVQATAAELRAQIKRIEAEKTELNRLLQEARQRIGGTLRQATCACFTKHSYMYITTAYFSAGGAEGRRAEGGV